MTITIEARQAYLVECALLEDFALEPPGIPEQLHRLVLYLQCDLGAFYSLPVPPDTLDRWFLWLLSVELKSGISAPVAELYRRRLREDEPTREEWQRWANATSAELDTTAAWAALAGVAGKLTAANAVETVAKAVAMGDDTYTRAQASLVRRMRAALVACAKGQTP